MAADLWHELGAKLRFILTDARARYLSVDDLTTIQIVGVLLLGNVLVSH